MALRALELFKELFGGEPDKALPRNHHCGSDVDNNVFHEMLRDGVLLAEACGKRRVAGRFRALERKVGKHEPTTEMDEYIGALIEASRGMRTNQQADN